MENPNMLNDYLFKTVMTKQKSTENILLRFINAVMANVDERILKSIEVLNPYMQGETYEDKDVILDILAKDEEGNFYNIEVQVARDPFFVERSLVYGSHVVTSQLKKGDPYQNLKSTVIINIFDYIEYPERERFHHIFIPCDKYDRDFELKNKMCYHYIEIPKLKEMPNKQKELELWLHFFKQVNTMGDDMIKEMYSEVPEILEASRIYNDALADDATRYHALSREKFLRTQLSRKELAFEEGKNLGLTQGLAEGKAEIARNLKAKNFSISEIAEITGLAIQEIETL